MIERLALRGREREEVVTMVSDQELCVRLVGPRARPLRLLRFPRQIGLSLLTCHYELIPFGFACRVVLALVPRLTYLLFSPMAHSVDERLKALHEREALVLGK